MQFSTSFIPDIRFGAGIFGSLADMVKNFEGTRAALIVMDGFLAARGQAKDLARGLLEAGIEPRLYSDFSGEPKLQHLRAASEMARGADMVIGVGGGSALDIAKVAACCAASGEDPMFYALAANPLPKKPLKKIMVPTTAGTGSETSATNIFAGPEGRKLWIWGPETKADLVLLDPELTISLPPNLTAWCGMDAFIHAFEAATNRNSPAWGHAGAKLYAHEALRLVAGSLEAAVKAPGNLEARGKVLLGSCYAGIAIDNCGTAIAHNISHALAGLGAVHHGLATALGFEATLPWLVAKDTADLNDAARAIGLSGATQLSAFVSGLMDRCGIERALPKAFDAFSAQDLAAEMRAPENQPMRRSTIREVTDVDIDAFAAKIMTLPKTL
ncbi:iron-containing alcohol dehydrogenase [Aliirhizobium cellulosilyticum]|jgi:alcohol dehydrogenase class IV|uniref:Alcohol dehydrogenase class IV n=1 Tax=Aliirhizobium cellulosilyticum TaxID=393664 RepID=A0A7W6SBX9_9HYPH|nr:iron-containing alcohol dehydrogenase [Rhizobium cellulosilyticum]MBB4350903.1 alcohol dehydrogenase class IV [Rhizobium cellulosilyticum]MBB4414110.1 alcohol dehydrogenase class IV [Rhizobium cellulosilyticum]MBB4448725.1 alcohol dehydrogenase class IV [Rhizobium cellulosilyticum]